jgi:hypothetical protein
VIELWRYVANIVDSLSLINKVLGTQFYPEAFDKKVYALWRRIDSLHKIRCLPPAHKRQKISHEMVSLASSILARGWLISVANAAMVQLG